MIGGSLISRMRLINYKGFADYTVSFRNGTTLLVGPNNAGKSTIINALRLASKLVSTAKRRKPDISARDAVRRRNVRAYNLLRHAGDLVNENVRHEFRELDSRIELHFSNKAVVHIVWPVDGVAFFYLEYCPGKYASSPDLARLHFDTLGVVQTLSPVEPAEALLSENYVKDNLGGRLASRHFRNQLYYMVHSAADDPYIDFALTSTPELESLSFTIQVPEVNVYFTETVSRREKELSWAGDGLQIWLQLLFHIWRQSDCNVLILDEPDVYLHPDLQRRLINLLEKLEIQVVLATHASEMLVEASRDSVVIVDRTKTTSGRVTDEGVLADLNDTLGSGFNLKLARVLRSRVALFVEGQDMRVLREIADTVGAKLVAQERGLSIVSMGGATRRSVASSFGWLNEKLLESAVEVYVVIDRDYMSESAVAAVLNEFNDAQLTAHVWGRKELESYLLNVPTIVRVSGMCEEFVQTSVVEVVESLKEHVFSRIFSAEVKDSANRKYDPGTLYERCRKGFEIHWANGDWKYHAVPAKDVISGLNRLIQSQKGRTLNAHSLAVAMLSHEVPDEMRKLLLDINRKLV